jgi:hypothetical protein
MTVRWISRCSMISRSFPRGARRGALPFDVLGAVLIGAAPSDWPRNRVGGVAEGRVSAGLLAVVIVLIVGG